MLARLADQFPLGTPPFIALPISTELGCRCEPPGLTFSYGDWYSVPGPHALVLGIFIFEFIKHSEVMC